MYARSSHSGICHYIFHFLRTVPLLLLAVFFHRNNDIIVSEMLCSVIVITHNHCCCSILIEMICGASKQSIEPNLTVCTHLSFMKINYIIINIVIICLLFKISFSESNWLGLSKKSGSLALVLHISSATKKHQSLELFQTKSIWMWILTLNLSLSELK